MMKRMQKIQKISVDVQTTGEIFQNTTHHSFCTIVLVLVEWKTRTAPHSPHSSAAWFASRRDGCWCGWTFGAATAVAFPAKRSWPRPFARISSCVLESRRRGPRSIHKVSTSARECVLCVREREGRHSCFGKELIACELTLSLDGFFFTTAAPTLCIVRFSDPTTRLVMVRTPREYCGLVRATITLLTSLSSNNSNQRVVLHVLSVNGSARTAKVTAIREVRRFYRDRLLQQANKKTSGDPTMTSLKDKDTAKLCRSMEEGLQQISSIDF